MDFGVGKLWRVYKMEKDKTLFGELAFDSIRNQEVIILFLWENIFADGRFIFAKLVGKNDCKIYSTDFRNLIKIEK